MNLLHGRWLHDPESGVEGRVVRISKARTGGVLICLETKEGEFTEIPLTCLRSKGAKHRLIAVDSPALQSFKNLTEAAMAVLSAYQQGDTVRNLIPNLRSAAEHSRKVLHELPDTEPS